MALTTLPDADIPVDFGLTKQVTPRVVEANFGDGYTQRARDGINSIKPVWRVSWTNTTLAEAQTIEQFLEARGGHEAFLWSPPNEVQQVFRCKTYSLVPTGAGFADVTAEFTREFDLNV